MICRGTLSPAARQAAKDAEKLMAISSAGHGALESHCGAHWYTVTWGTGGVVGSGAETWSGESTWFGVRRLAISD